MFQAVRIWLLYSKTSLQLTVKFLINAPGKLLIRDQIKYRINRNASNIPREIPTHEKHLHKKICKAERLGPPPLGPAAATH